MTAEEETKAKRIRRKAENNPILAIVIVAIPTFIVLGSFITAVITLNNWIQEKRTYLLYETVTDSTGALSVRVPESWDNDILLDQGLRFAAEAKGESGPA